MKRHPGVFLLACFALFHLGSGLLCYKCEDYKRHCGVMRECIFEDSCISLKERGGKTVRHCIPHRDCNSSRLSHMYPSMTTFRCCNNDLCNSANSISGATMFLALAGSLLSMWWSCS